MAARVAREARARVEVEGLTHARAAVRAGLTRAHVEDDVAESARRARIALTLYARGRRRHALASVAARVRRAEVDAVLAIGSVIPGRAQTRVGDESLETHASAQTRFGRACAQRRLTRDAREARLTRTRVVVGYGKRAHAIVHARLRLTVVDHGLAVLAVVARQAVAYVLTHLAHGLARGSVRARVVRARVYDVLTLGARVACRAHTSVAVYAQEVAGGPVLAVGGTVVFDELAVGTRCSCWANACCCLFVCFLLKRFVR